MNHTIFHSKSLTILVIFLFIFLLSSDVLSQRNVSAQYEIEKFIKEGKELYENGEYEESIIKFLEATKLARTRKELSEVYFNLSATYYANNQSDQAEEYLKKSLEILPERTIDAVYYPPGFAKLFNQIKAEFIKPKEREKRPVVKGQPITPKKVRKGGGALFLIVGLLAAGGGAAALLLGKKSTGEGSGGVGTTTGSIQVNSTPTGASVYLDGSDTGQTTNCTLTDISAGSHTIKLVKEGYQDYETSVSVTAGQTATVDAPLTPHTITVTSPSSDTIWTKGEQVEITWETDESARFPGNVRAGSGLNPLSPGSSVSPSFQRRRAFHYRRSFLEVRRARRGLESMGLLQDREIELSKLSRIQGVSKKFSSSSKEVNSVPQRGRDIGTIKRNMRFERINFPKVPGDSSQRTTSLAEMNTLTITNVKIELYKGGSLAQAIESSTDNDGSYTWTVDTSLAGGSDYQVRISCASDSSIYGESAQFTIEEKSITVTSPTSTTIWAKGYSADISWTSIGTISNVQIDLYKGSILKKIIASSTANDGFYTWTQVDTSLAAGSDYKIRISSTIDSSIYGESDEFQITHEMVFVAKWGSNGSGNGEFDRPKGITVDSAGYVYVADTHNHRIQKFTSGGTFITKWGSQGSGDGQFDEPQRIAVDSSGYVYVADTLNSRIQKFTSGGTFVTKWGSYGSGDGQFNYPFGIELDGDGYVYISDYHNHRIQKFTSDGAFVTKWGSQGSGNGQFNKPEGIAVDSSGYVYVADSYNHRIQKFTSGGTFIAKWGSEGSGDGQFNAPCGIAIDGAGYVYVSDTLNSRIQKFTSIGVFVTKWGSQGSGDGQFDRVYGIAADESGYVYVTDFNNHRIQKFGPASTSQAPAEQRFNLLKSPLINKLNAQQKLFNKKDRENKRRK